MQIITIVIFLPPRPKLGFRPLADRLYHSIARLHTCHACHTSTVNFAHMQCVLKLIVLPTILHVCEPNQCMNDCVLLFFLFCVAADDGS